MADVLGVQGLDPAANTPGEFDKLIRVEIDRWRKLVKAAGIKID